MKSKNSENTGVNVQGRVLIAGTVGERGGGIGRGWEMVEGIHFVSFILSLLLVSSALQPTLFIPQEKNSFSESSSNSMYVSVLTCLPISQATPPIDIILGHRTH